MDELLERRQLANQIRRYLAQPLDPRLNLSNRGHNAGHHVVGVDQGAILEQSVDQTSAYGQGLIHGSTLAAESPNPAQRPVATLKKSPGWLGWRVMIQWPVPGSTRLTPGADYGPFWSRSGALRFARREVARFAARDRVVARVTL